MMAGDDDLAALREQVSLVSGAAISASNLDHAFQLQLAEAIQASLPPDAAGPSSSPSLLELEPSSDLSHALALHAADLARVEQERRDARTCRASVRVALARAWAHDGDYFERPLDPNSFSARPLFRVLFKGMTRLSGRG